MPKLTDLFDETQKSGKDLVPTQRLTLADLSGTTVDPDAVQAKVDITNQVIPKVQYGETKIMFTVAPYSGSFTTPDIWNATPTSKRQFPGAYVSGTTLYSPSLSQTVGYINDVGDFENFVFFNSALDYFNISGERMINEYPADGKYGDIQRFISQSDGYQRHLLDVWPTSNGCIDLTSGSASINDPLTGIDLRGGEWTIEFHVQPVAGQQLVRLYNQSGSVIFRVGTDSGTLVVSGSSGSASLSPLTSSYYAIVGSAAASKTLFYEASASGSAFHLIGSGSNVGPVSGNVRMQVAGMPVRELRIWNIARTADELKADWNRRVFANENLLYYGRYTEGSGSALHDYSGNKLHGVASYPQAWSTASLDMSPQDRGDYVLDLVNPALISFITTNQTSGTAYDRQNANHIINLVPDQFLILEDDRQTEVLKNLLYLMARQFDEMKVKIDQFVRVFQMNYTQFDQTPDALLADALTFWGWTPKGSFLSQDAFQYFFGYNVLSGSAAEYDNQRLDTELFKIKNEFWKRTLNNLIYLYKTKGTREAVESLIRVYGMDEHLVRLKEFGIKPDVGIQTYRINSEKSATAIRMVAGQDPIETVNQPISFISSSAIELNIKFKSPGEYVDGVPSPPVQTTGVIFHMFQGAEARLPQPFAFGLGGVNTGTASQTTTEELYFTRDLNSTTGSLHYATYLSGVQQGVVDLLSLPIFDGRFYHVMVHKDGNMVHAHVMHLDDTIIDMDIESSPVLMSATLKAGGYDFSVGGGGDAIYPTGEFWVNEVHVWRSDITDQEMLDHALNPFSYGTDTPERQVNLSIRWRLDKETDAPGVAIDSTPPPIDGIIPSGTVYDRFLFDVNYIAPPDYGWNEEKIRFVNAVEDDPNDTFAHNNAVALEFNLIDALNQDASLLMSTLDNWNNVIGDPANRFRESYPVLDALRAQYFNRLEGRLNFRVFADFLDFYDRSFIDLVAKLLPARANFKGGEFVVESHIYERPKAQQTYRRRDVELVPEGDILINSPHYGPQGQPTIVITGYPEYPSGRTMVSASTDHTFSASAYWWDGSPADVQFTWSLANENDAVGTITPSGSTCVYHAGFLDDIDRIQAAIVRFPDDKVSVRIGYSNGLKSIVLSTSSIDINGTASFQLQAYLSFSDNTSITGTTYVSWSVVPDGVASVTTGGLVQGIFSGQATVVATLVGLQASAAVQVHPILTGILVQPQSSTLDFASGTQFYTAVGKYIAGPDVQLNNPVIDWYTSNTGVATIDAGGVAHFVGTGSVDFWASGSGFLSNTATLLITASVDQVNITPHNQSMYRGQTTQLTAAIHWTDGHVTSGTVDWSSSVPAIASVTTPGGLVSATLNGDVVVYAVTASVTGSTSIHIAPVLIGITIAPESASINMPGTQQYSATGTYNGGFPTNITNQVSWHSSDPSVATIDSSGLATGQGSGTTNIYASSGTIYSNTGTLDVTGTGV